MSPPHPFDDDVSAIVSTADLPNPPMTFEEKCEELAAAHQLIRTKYDAGIPFFTKMLFRDVVRQLESKVDERIPVTGLDGLAVHFPIETGSVYRDHPYGDDFACFVTKPRLMYRTIQDLLAPQDAHCYSVCRAYLPVEVIHATEVRDAHTNEVVDLWPTADHATVKSRFEQARRSLEASEDFARIKSTLSSITIPPSIDKIVALGCSTISSVKDDCVTTSMPQHTLALAIRDILANLYGESSSTIQCYSEDPFYTPVDEQVLSEVGFAIVDDLRAFLEVDETSVVIAMDPDIPVRQIVADIARPAMMVWNKMMEDYIKVPFPAQNNQYGDIVMYVRSSIWRAKDSVLGE